MTRPAYDCGDDYCCGGFDYPECAADSCTETVETVSFPGVTLRTDTIPCHYSDDQGLNTPYLYSD